MNVWLRTKTFLPLRWFMRVGQNRLRLLSAIVAMALIATSCSGSEPDSATGPTATAAGSTEDSTIVDGEPIDISAPDPMLPGTPVGAKMQWILDQLHGVDPLEAELWEAHMHPDFLDQVSAEEVVGLLNIQIRPAQPFSVTSYEGIEGEAIATVQGAIGEPFSLSVAVDEQDLIIGLLIGPAVPPVEPATSLEEITERFDAMNADIGLLVMRHGGGEPLTVLEREPYNVAPMGSVFKLYVLLAVADAIVADEMAWNDELIVRDDLRSLPTGQLQDAPPDTVVTVAEAAELMISISDNTATDLLIDAVGRERVQAAVAATGHSDPDLLDPFPTTQELFTLGWVSDADTVTAWAGGDSATRHEILEEMATAEFTMSVEDFTSQAVWTEGRDWFASPRDVTAALIALEDHSDPKVMEILSINPGLRPSSETGDWTTIGFKGGSAPGVLAGAWVGRADDATVLTVVVMASSANAAAVYELEAELFSLAADLIRLS